MRSKLSNFGRVGSRQTRRNVSFRNHSFDRLGSISRLQNQSRSFVSLSTEFFKEIPKTDLHVHLDGSLRVGTILDIAKQEHISLPPLAEYPSIPTRDWTLEMLQSQFKPHYESLVDYLRSFSYTTAVMQSPEALHRTAYEFAEDCIADNVRYVEVRFAPQLLAHDGMDIRSVLKYVNSGLAQAKAKDALKKPKNMPSFEYGIICCAMRCFGAEYSSYYKRFCDLTPSMAPKKRAPLASLALVHEIIASREIDGVPVVALDIAGAEAGFPAVDHVEAFRLAHKNFIHATVHAGEAYGPESIYQAVTDLYASRIGHGYHLFHPDRIQDPKIHNKERYVNDLLTFIGESRTTLEVCLTSNLQTMPHLNGDLSIHSFRQMLDNHLNVILSTDNTLMSFTTVSKELELASRTFGLSRKKIKEIVLNGFEQSFWQGSYRTKTEYIQQIQDYYYKIEEKYRPIHTTPSADGMVL